MLIIVKVIGVYMTIISIGMLLQGIKKEHIVCDEINNQLDQVLKDKDYLCHLEYLKNRQKERKDIACHSHIIHKVK